MTYVRTNWTPLALSDYNDRRWYASERRIEREYGKLDALYLAGHMTDDEYSAACAKVEEKQHV